MSRTERLLELIQILRSHRHPVTGPALASRLSISLRSLYRDIATLQEQGARIDGAPGLGYILRPGFMLPPLMFSEEEIEALVLGSRWVADRTDNALAAAARSALVKIAAVLPPALKDGLDASGLLVGPGAAQARPSDAAGIKIDMAHIRRAIRKERKLAITYRDAKDTETSRTIWPFALAFFDRAEVVVAWCESRAAFRNFRTDRIGALEISEARYPRNRQALLQEWREGEGIQPQ